MPWWNSSLGSKHQSAAAKPTRRKQIEQGFFWGGPGVTALTAGRGWNQDVVGESFYRSNLVRVSGGETIEGVNISCAAELRRGQFDGSLCIEVYVSGYRVGSISRVDTASLMNELMAIAADNPVVAKARISAGFEGGDYQVKLSLARPLTVRTS